MLATFFGTASASNSDLELAQELMYCGKLKMTLARAGNENSEMANQEYKKAHLLMLTSIYALVPEEMKETEYAKAQMKFRDDLNAKLEEEKKTPNSVSSFFKEKLLACNRLQSEKGFEAYKRGLDAMAKKPESAK